MNCAQDGAMYALSLPDLVTVSRHFRWCADDGRPWSALMGHYGTFTAGVAPTEAGAGETRDMKHVKLTLFATPSLTLGKFYGGYNVPAMNIMSEMEDIVFEPGWGGSAEGRAGVWPLRFFFNRFMGIKLHGSGRFDTVLMVMPIRERKF